MRFFLTAVLFAIAIFLPPQTANAQQATTSHMYDCSKLPYASRGCNSYNEMVEKGDKDVLSAVKGGQATFVCFRPDEDVFFLASVENVDDSDFSPPPGRPNVLQAGAAFSYERFKGGVQEDSTFLYGDWTKYKTVGIEPIFSAKDDKDTTHAQVNENELSYDETFENLNNTKTTYNLQIRQSTLRFNESYTFPDKAPDDKSAAAPATPAQERTDTNGYCAEFGGE